MERDEMAGKKVKLEVTQVTDQENEDDDRRGNFVQRIWDTGL